jgi:YD repeat-containing protein
MSTYLKAFLFFIVSCPWLHAVCGVNIKNGNFYISYTDIDLTGKKGTEITRSYNSSSVTNGLFGLGWGSVLETRLFIIGDGNLVVNYWGAGASILYSYDRQDEDLLNSCIDQLVAAALENEDLENTPADISEFRTALRQSVTDRALKWIKYYKLKLVTIPARLPVTQWVSNQYQRDRISIRGEDFIQLSEDGTSLHFNKDGFLTRSISTGGNNVFSLFYKEGNRLSLMKDNGGNSCYFTLTSNGKVQSIQAKGGAARYWYKDDLLVRSLDAGKNDYRFEYDADYNMISIQYTDGTSMRMEYDEVTNFCRKVTDKSGLVTEYVYKFFYDENGEVDDRHYATYVLRSKPGSARTDSSFYEYEIRERENGEEYQYRYFHNRNGETFEEINDEQCSWPRVIRKNSQELRFTYSPQCGIVRRESDSLRIEAILDTLLQQPVRLSYTNKITGDTLTKEIRLNEAGNAVHIRFRNNETHVSYNSGQLPVKIEFEQGLLLFQYDAEKRVQKVTAPTSGTMEIFYDTDGNISRVSSKQGEGVAQQINRLYEAAQQRLKNARIHYEFIPIIH